MFRIKRLYSFILQSFLPLLLVTFGVCLFIMLMQFLWQFVNEMVGKGINLMVLGKMFFYAGLMLVPMTLPLAVLLASLITFGNLGEHMELLAMKSAGISLLRIMRPIVVCLIFLVCGAFYFQNDILPATQVKLWTFVSSMKQKSLQLEIPEGSFCKEIQGFSVYVESKNKDILRNMMIYDYSNGFESVKIIVADSGRLSESADKKYLVLTLYSGESFQNFPRQGNQNYASHDKIPYCRETFKLKELLIKFDSNFNLVDESIAQNKEISKNRKELIAYADSVQAKVDTTTLLSKESTRDRVYRNTFLKRYDNKLQSTTLLDDTTLVGKFDDFFAKNELPAREQLIEMAKNKAESFRNDYQLLMMNQSEGQAQVRAHLIELHKKYSLSLACLLFFFIGAPLGAIIRKGGLGMPTVLSVIIFLSYYTINIFGLKMARQGVWPVWQGMWLSSLVLAILGAFFTYKAVNDSVILSSDAWKDFVRRFLGKREMRNYQRKEVVITPPDYSKNLILIQKIENQCVLCSKNLKNTLLRSLISEKNNLGEELQTLIDLLEKMIEDLRNSKESLIIGKIMDYPVIKLLHLEIFNKQWLRYICIILFPLGIIIYLIELFKRKQIKKDIETIHKINRELANEITKFTEIT